MKRVLLRCALRRRLWRAESSALADDSELQATLAMLNLRAGKDRRHGSLGRHCGLHRDLQKETVRRLTCCA